MVEEKKKVEDKEPDEKKAKVDLLETLLSGKLVTETVETRYGTFVITLPLPKDIRDIEITVAARLGGQPVAAFTAETLANFRCYATLDAVVSDAPEWWKKLESAEDCPDDDLVLELYRRYLRFYVQTQKHISKSRFRGTHRVGKVRTSSRSVDSGPFSDIAN